MTTPVHIGAREARSKFADLISRVYYGGETIIVERAGKPVVAVISIELYEQLIAECEARFAVIDRLRDKTSGVHDEEVQVDVDEALKAVRASN
jgi:prevent-host-death family protein